MRLGDAVTGPGTDAVADSGRAPVAGDDDGLRDDPRLLAFVDGRLGSVLALDPVESHHALTGLWAWAGSGGMVADFARRIVVGRPAGYARLARLCELVDADLTDPEVRTSRR